MAVGVWSMMMAERKRCCGHSVTDSRCLEALSRHSESSLIVGICVIQNLTGLGVKIYVSFYNPLFLPSLCVAEHSLWFVWLLELVDFFVR